MTIIIATHDIDFAYGWADEAIILQSGRLLASGNAPEILTHEDVCKVLGAKPLVAEINRQLSLIGIDLRDIEYMPRTKRELLQAMSAHTRQENG
jgi:cobalt/nickel transport system ATP-binding protein